MTTLIILNDPPYGTERVYNGLRLAQTLIKQKTEVTIFLTADAVSASKSNQKTLDGYYNLERMLKRIAAAGHVLLCGACMDARGLDESAIFAGATRSTMEELAIATLAADRVLVF